MSLRHDFTIDFANQALEKMFGYDSGELINKNFEILILEKDSERCCAKAFLDRLAPERRSNLNNIEITLDGTIPHKTKSEFIQESRFEGSVRIDCLDLALTKLVSDPHSAVG